MQSTRHKAHFPLLAAAGYLGLMVWHSGLSGSAPLLVNTSGHFLEDQIGLIPLSETVFQPFNLAFLTVMLVGTPLLMLFAFAVAALSSTFLS